MAGNQTAAPATGPIATTPVADNWNMVNQVGGFGTVGYSTDVVAAHQDLFFQENRKKQSRLNGSTPNLSTAPTPSAAASSGSGSTAQATLLQHVKVADDVAMTVALGELGVDINDPKQIQKGMDNKITTAGEVLKLVNAYHKAVIRPEMVHLTIQLDQVLIKLDNRVNFVQANLNWLATDQRKEQRQRASVTLMFNGFPKDMSPEKRLYMIKWMLSQVPALCAWVNRMGFNHTAVSPGDSIFHVLATEPITLQYGKKWSSMTMLVFKGFELRKSAADIYVGKGNTPLYTDEKTAVGGQHVQVLYSTPQYQRKLEVPIRVLMKALNNIAQYEDCNMVPLWKSLTLMFPTDNKELDENARACAHVEYKDEQGELTCILHIAKEVHGFLLQEHPTTLHEDGSKCDQWEAAWYAQLWGTTLDEDKLESSAKQSMQAGVAPPGISAKGKGKGKHWAQALVHADESNPFPIKLTWKAHDHVPFNWNEYCMKFRRDDMKVDEDKATTNQGKPA